MPTHDAVASINFDLIEDPLRSPSTMIDSAIYGELHSEFFVADHEAVIPVPSATEHEAVLLDDTTPAKQLLDRIYFFPIDPQTLEHLLQFGLITGLETQQFTIWNAYIAQGKNLSNIASIDPEGTQHNVPTLPIFFNGMEKETFDMSVLEIGPAVQDTDYFFMIGGVTFRLDVLGERLQELDAVFSPNWASPVRVSFEFQTVIWRNNSFFEQRRPLFENVLREMQADFLVNEEEFEQAHNVLKRSHDKFFFVPIFTELLHPSNATIQGSSVLTFEESIADYYHLRNFGLTLLIQSIFDNTLNEYLVIDSFDIGANEITLVSPVSNAYVTGQTVVMPVMIGMLQGFKPKYATDKVAEFQLDFKELRRGE